MKLKQLLALLQIYRSRRQPQSAELNIKANIIDHLYDAVKIYSLNNDLYDYARQQNHRPTVTHESIFSAARNLHLWEDQTELYEILERRHPNES